MFVDSQTNRQYPVLQDFEYNGGGYTRGPRLLDRPKRAASGGGLVGEVEQVQSRLAMPQRLGANLD